MVGRRPPPAPVAHGTQGESAEPERQEDRDGEHKTRKGQDRERADHQDE